VEKKIVWLKIAEFFPVVYLQKFKEGKYKVNVSQPTGKK